MEKMIAAYNLLSPEQKKELESEKKDAEKTLKEFQEATKLNEQENK
ncbi:5931_t:CDS:2 [Ambispora gerdemannii]|uniref:5931_t:CDS:1 n=1 Tax=Ambispora gerdemannii TaxID=144530 RepID=A0A9N8YN79_9GLOM|nr:5931_t:CDS:2 [Ambispora gerdemannii]